jgi:branched-chain amino acid transport system permease protein
MYIASIVDSALQALVDVLLNFGEPDSVRQFIILTYTGISEGALLALIALGLVLIYKSTDVINFAHGEIMVLGAFIAFEVLVARGLPLVPGIAVAALVMLGFGVMLERLVLRRLIGEPVISVIMITIGLSSVITAFIGLYWGVQPRRYGIEFVPPILGEEGFYELQVEGARRAARLPYDRLYTIALVFFLLFLFILFFQRSKDGIAMRAAADDQQSAMSMGISIKRVFAVAWSIAALAAGIAGVMVGNLTDVSENISGVGLRAFPVIILGGLDSIPGAIAGGLIIGLTEQYVSGYVDPTLKNVIPYVVLLVVLMIRPYGLFGQKIIERV